MSKDRLAILGDCAAFRAVLRTRGMAILTNCSAETFGAVFPDAVGPDFFPPEFWSQEYANLSGARTVEIVNWVALQLGRIEMAECYARAHGDD